MSILRRRRSWVAAVAVAAAMAAAVPTAAFAYWVVSTTTSARAQSATFAISGPGATEATLGGARTNLEGFTGTRQTSTMIKNTGSVAWESVDIAMTQTSGLQAPAVVSLGFALVQGNCPVAASGQYMQVPASGRLTLSTPAAQLQPGAGARLCTTVSYSRLSAKNKNDAFAGKITVTPRLHNWAVASAPATLTLSASAAGVAKCVSGSGAWSDAQISIVTPMAGKYRLVVDGDEKETRSLGADATATFNVEPKIWSRWNRVAVLIERQNGAAWESVASSEVSREYLGAVTCSE